MSVSNILKQDALEYHSSGKPGKIEVKPTKSTATQRDLSLAYSPGVAEPCLEIAENVEKVYDYTAKGNLVGVISNGTAVLGLGNIGAEASKFLRIASSRSVPNYAVASRAYDRLNPVLVNSGRVNFYHRYEFVNHNR